ncbi:oxidoreductase [Falsiroseomonas bella]|uniref:Oxidoreductase n=1 Tax=Falsiroseomonas bella TaxID=2184016 RepID=A0A317F8Y2_9PROT|nr:FAD-dependent oxidoreductase [Falsiroseomonas bella]PWS34883.1 oxidoreductase [Falsiroseomonas bella]
MNAAFPHLFAPLDLAGRRLRNRIGFAAMSTRFSDPGRVSERLITHLAARARGGAGIVITEAFCAAPSARTPVRPWAFDEGALPGFAQLAEAVQRHGAALVGQLWHGGSAHHGPRGLDSVGASAVPDGMSWTVPRVLEDAEIEGLVADYADSAHRLQRAGFAGVEVSAAHGFLPLQFLSPVTNRREDRWGGDAAGRSRFVREILRAIRARCGAGFIIGLKMPADDGVPGSIDAEEAQRLVRHIVADAPPDWLCFSQGSHSGGWALHLHAPDMHDPVAPYRALWRAMREAAGAVPIAAIGRIQAPHVAEAILAGGDADLVMLARPLLADANWPAKAEAGRAAAITPCIGCNACWGEIHRGVATGCSVNPHVGSPQDGLPVVRAAQTKRVVVVGAGMAGLQAAVGAAERGHRVTLFGASAAPGGAAALHARLPGCGDIARAIAHLVARAGAAGVRMRLGAPVEAAQVLAESPETVILATGAAMPPPRGFADPAMAARDIRSAMAALLAEPARRGGLAVLLDLDATPATYDAAELLAERFDKVLLVTPREAIARDSPLLVAQGIQKRLSARRVTLLTCRDAISFDDGAVILRHALTAELETIRDVSLLTFASGRVPRDGLVAQLRAAGVRVRLVGDSLAPRLMLSAVREGEAAAEAA